MSIQSVIAEVQARIAGTYKVKEASFEMDKILSKLAADCIEVEIVVVTKDEFPPITALKLTDRNIK